MFKKVLIANRGEIAIRVMRACRELDVKTVAVYSEVNKNALFAKYADEAHYIGPAPAPQSYLNMDSILDVAHRTGAEGIHPGYGFLAENPEFASRWAKEGMAFIGPTSHAIESVGSKRKAANEKAVVESGIIPGIVSRTGLVGGALDTAEK